MLVVSVCGSLREGSSNAQLLRIATELAPPAMTIRRWDGMASLPHFNPDLDDEGCHPPQPVAAMRAVFAAAQGVVLSCPEYAHGVPGSLKNALDWTVSSGEWVGKPVLLLNASVVGGQWAQAALHETLTVMSAQVLRESLVKPFLQRKLMPGAVLEPGEATAVRDAMTALATAILQGSYGAPPEPTSW